MRTALYIRFSSARQIGGTSLPDQLARLRADAHAAGERVTGEYIDQARSGASIAKRDAYQRLLADARAGAFDRVRVESVDRGHRNEFDRRAFEAEMGRLGISVVYSGEAAQQAPEYRKFQRGIKGLVAELESDAASQRTYKRHLHRAKQGKWRGGIHPYGLASDGAGWFVLDPDVSPHLLWILSRRAEGWGYHRIAKALNQGIGEPPVIPPTPGVLAYQRQPLLERQDPETGDVTYVAKRAPRATWTHVMIRRICRQAVDGVYAGVYQWGRTHNRFSEDAEGHAKEAVRVPMPPLLPDDLLRSVRAVELGADVAPAQMAERSSFLLSLRCGCGQAMHGYTSSKYKVLASGETKTYTYRMYRCAGRANRPGTCTMPLLNADEVEQAVIDTVFAYLPLASLRSRVLAAIEQQRADIATALGQVTAELADARATRDDALRSLTDRTLSGAVKAAMATYAEEQVEAFQRLEDERDVLLAGLDALDGQARSVDLLLCHPDLDPARWKESAAMQALKRLFAVLLHSATVERCADGGVVVHLRVYRMLSGNGRENGSDESVFELFTTNVLCIPKKVRTQQ